MSTCDWEEQVPDFLHARTSHKPAQDVHRPAQTLREPAQALHRPVQDMHEPAQDLCEPAQGGREAAQEPRERLTRRGRRSRIRRRRWGDHTHVNMINGNLFADTPSSEFEIYCCKLKDLGMCLAPCPTAPCDLILSPADLEEIAKNLMSQPQQAHISSIVVPTPPTGGSALVLVRVCRHPR